MTTEDSDLKEFSGAENANPQTQENHEDQEIVELQGRGSRQEIKAKNRARKADRSQLPGVNLQ